MQNTHVRKLRISVLLIIISVEHISSSLQSYQICFRIQLMGDCQRNSCLGLRLCCVVGLSWKRDLDLSWVIKFYACRQFDSLHNDFTDEYPDTKVYDVLPFFSYANFASKFYSKFYGYEWCMIQCLVTYLMSSPVKIHDWQ